MCNMQCDYADGIHMNPAVFHILPNKAVGLLNDP